MINILYQNSEWIAVDKPPGVSVHNAEGSENLLEILKNQFGKLSPVHRLDKETSGIQILALTDKAARDLAIAFEKHEVRKTYMGVVRGDLQPESGIWNKPISDKSEGRDNPAGKAKDRVQAETHFLVQVRNRFFTQVLFNLKTGRQHQIRKHAAVAGHALVGDSRYGDKRYNLKVLNIYQINRMLLHCYEIEILGQEIVCPPPAEFSTLLMDT